jgi:flagellar basal body-associated protein FliL
MFLAQIIAPALLVLALFVVGHAFVQSNYSGIYTPKVILDVPVAEESEESEEVLSEAAARAISQGSYTEEEISEFRLMRDKYNYLKIEYVFQGSVLGENSLFSLEVAIATKQPTVLSDFFIKALREIEADLVAETTVLILEPTREQLESVSGRAEITDKILVGLNAYLEREGMRPNIDFAYIINVNIV